MSYGGRYKGYQKGFEFGGDFDNELSSFSSKVGKSHAIVEPCWKSHPVIEFAVDGGKVGKFIGGSCYYPDYNADVVVGLDSGMKMSPQYPWKETKRVEFLFKITDMSVPTSPKDFVQLIAYLCEQLNQGKTVHVGCIGGHGRTGMVLSAVLKEMTGEVDAIAWVRKNYCKKAVETSEQVKFLNKHFGIKVVEGTKDYLAGGFPYSKKHGHKALVEPPVSNLNQVVPTHKQESAIYSANTNFCIWNEKPK